MVSCIKIETASLVFASLSLLITSIGSLVCIAMMVHINVLTAYLNSLNNGAERALPVEFEAMIVNYGLYANVHLAVILSTMAVSLGFSIILIKGLLSKKAHLVKAYFVYGITKKTILLLSLLYLFSSGTFHIEFGLISLVGCFSYALILFMIRKTYLKLSNTDHDQFCHKKLEEEKSSA